MNGNLPTFKFNGHTIDYGVLQGEPVFGLDCIFNILGEAPKSYGWCDLNHKRSVVHLSNSTADFTASRKLDEKGERFFTVDGLYRILWGAVRIRTANDLFCFVTKNIFSYIYTWHGYVIDLPEDPMLGHHPRKIHVTSHKGTWCLCMGEFMTFHYVLWFTARDYEKRHPGCLIHNIAPYCLMDLGPYIDFMPVESYIDMLKETMKEGSYLTKHQGYIAQRSPSPMLHESSNDMNAFAAAANAFMQSATIDAVLEDHRSHCQTIIDILQKFLKEHPCPCEYTPAPHVASVPISLLSVLAKRLKKLFN